MARPEREATGAARPLAVGRFVLFTECVLTGLYLTVALLGVVTALAAFAACCRHLGRVMRGDDSGLGPLLADLRAAWPGSWHISLLGLTPFLLLYVNTLAAQAGAPGGGYVVALTVAAVIAVLTFGMRAAAAWHPDTTWPALTREASRDLVRDLPGSALLAAGLVVLALVTWQMAPLFVPMVGCLVAAAVAVRYRYLRSREAR